MRCVCESVCEVCVRCARVCVWCMRVSVCVLWVMGIQTQADYERDLQEQQSWIDLVPENWSSLDVLWSRVVNVMFCKSKEMIQFSKQFTNENASQH